MALAILAIAPIGLLIAGTALRNAAAVAGGALAALVALWAAVSLGYTPAPPFAAMTLLKASVGAAVLVFASTALPTVKRNIGLSALSAGVALIILGIGVLNIVFAGRMAALVDVGILASLGGALTLSAYALSKQDASGAVVAPAVIVGALGLAATGGGGAFAHAGALASIGALAAGSIGMLARDAISGSTLAQRTLSADQHLATLAAETAQISPRDRSRIVQEAEEAEGQLAQALDYVGIAVWDWSAKRCIQTASFTQLMGAEGDGQFTPDAMRNFVKHEDRDDFDRQVFGVGGQDGSFDWSGELVNGVKVRMRGARAVGVSGELERVVLFLEANPSVDHSTVMTTTSVAATDSGSKSAIEVTQSAAPKATGETPEPGKVDPLLSAAAASLTGAVAQGDYAQRTPDATALNPGQIDTIEASADSASKGGRALFSRAISSAAATSPARTNPFLKRRSKGLQQENEVVLSSLSTGGETVDGSAKSTSEAALSPAIDKPRASAEALAQDLKRGPAEAAPDDSATTRTMRMRRRGRASFLI
ncbi:MAG: hypothetical protein GC152_13820 [Alphaproteobacteria bacterium]|nr:hypothetical protein [Alphaproteobacteria bacterium]